MRESRRVRECSDSAPRDESRVGSRANISSREDMYNNLSYRRRACALCISIRISTFESREFCEREREREKGEGLARRDTNFIGLRG